LIDKKVMKIPKDIKKYRLGLHHPGEKTRIEIVEK